MFKAEQGTILSERYSLKYRLNHGGVGEVWLADDQIRHEDVVVKLLHPSLNAKPSAVDLLKREYETTRRLVHPNIVPVLEFNQDQSQHFLVSKYMGERTLGTYRGGDYRQFLPVLIPLVDALIYAHGAGIIHRDIKPDNIILDADNTAYLADFGLSLSPDAETDLSGGSLYYMSPQQLSGASPTEADDLYAFGVTLYELVNGHPPFYPNITKQQIQNDVPEPLRSQIVLPTELDELVFSLLAKSPDQRPASFFEVRERLSAFVELQDAATAPPDSVVVEPIPTTIESTEFSPSQAAPQKSESTPQPTTTDHKKTVPLGVGLALLGVAVAAVLFVVLLLPRFAPEVILDTPVAETETPEQGDSSGSANSSDSDSNQQPRAPYEEAKFQQERDEAQKFTLALLRKQIALEDKKVLLWAKEDFEKAQELADAGDELFREELFSDAMASYRQAEEILVALEGRADGVLDELLAAGAQAIAAGDAAAATDAYQTALDIKPKDPTAVAGLKLADRLPEIQQLMRSAQTNVQSGDLSEARSQYREVLKYQPDNQVAKSALEDVNRRLASISFDRAMSDGYAALQDNNYEAARTAFERAQKLRPSSQAPKDGLAQVDLTIRGGNIDALRAEARALERQEQWQAAADKYQAALDLDETLVFAKQGRFRALGRARLDNQLEAYIKNSQRLSEAEVFAHAQDVLSQADRLPRKGPRLAEQIGKVTELMQVARVPVTVRLESDNLTNVVMFKVGRIGNFESHELDLIPGTYTVVGTRTGYRDVRRNIVVTPGLSPPPIVVRCEDKI